MKAKRVNVDDLRKLCPRYGRHTNCKYWLPYKFVPETSEAFGPRGAVYKITNWSKGVWIPKKGIKGECFLADFCFDASEGGKNG